MCTKKLATLKVQASRSLLSFTFCCSIFKQFPNSCCAIEPPMTTPSNILFLLADLYRNASWPKASGYKIGSKQIHLQDV